MVGTHDSVEVWKKTFAYVGEFLFHWASLERRLGEALEAALGVDPLPAAILKANLQIRDKLHVLKTALSLYNHSAAPKMIGVLNEIGNYAAVRNMMAHDMFGPSEDRKGVQFFQVKAKGKLAFPDVIWREEHFEEAFKKIDDFRDAIKAGMEAFKIPRLALAIASRESRPTNSLATLGWPPLGAPDSPPLQPQPSRDSGKARSRRAPRKPRAPRR